MGDRRPGDGGLPPSEVALLTPPGRGGVAVIWIREPRGDWVRAHFRPRGTGEEAQDRVRAGWIVSGEEALDEVLLRVRGPGEAEIHCHGGKAVAERILRVAEAAGIQRVPAEGAVLPIHRMDRIQREALSLLIEAETEEAARMLADQAAGLLSHRLDRLREMGRREAEVTIRRLLETAPFGIAATEGEEIWIVGLPNGGKSTLANALLGWERAIVHESPGTTRDLLGERTALRGIPIDLFDTPGLRSGGEVGEGVAMGRADEGWREGQRVILCVDGTVPRPERDLIRRLDPDRDLLAVTKSDLPAAFEDDEVGTGTRPIRLSALTGEGLALLREEILQRLAPEGVPGDGEAVIFTRRQEEALRKVLEAVRAGDLDAAGGIVRECRWGDENGAAHG